MYNNEYQFTLEPKSKLGNESSVYFDRNTTNVEVYKVNSPFNNYGEVQKFNFPPSFGISKMNLSEDNKISDDELKNTMNLYIDGKVISLDLGQQKSNFGYIIKVTTGVAEADSKDIYTFATLFNNSILRSINYYGDYYYRYSQEYNREYTNKLTYERVLKQRCLIVMQKV